MTPLPFSRPRNRRPAEAPARDLDAGAEPPPLAERRPVLVVGLGNPGEKYAATRHNVGQWCVRLLARRHHVELRREGRMETARVQLDGATVHLGRVRGTYYNDSGGPVAGELRRLGLRPWQLLVVYDELDLPAGQLRLRAFGGHGGNNGMRSIISALGSQDFARIRIGIDRPYDAGAPVRDPDRVADWVLSVPGREDRARLEAAVERAADAVELAARCGIELAMSRFNPS